jgi:mono/diheme cytochrome c family protein
MKSLAVLAVMAVAAAGCGGSSSSGGSNRGNETAGKRVFLSAGCGSCHTLKAAGTSGVIGGPLDASLTFDRVVARVRGGGGGMPSYAKKLSASQIESVAVFVVAATKR